MKYIDNLLANPANRIAILSGEGEVGTPELFTGKRTRLAITRRINQELCGGDRWAYAIIETNDPEMCDGYAVTWSGGNDTDLGQTAFPDLDD